MRATVRWALCVTALWCARSASGQAALPGGRLEARTPAVDRVVDAFRQEYERAAATVAPGVGTDLEVPEAELYVGGERAIAYTTWSADRERFLTKVDWRFLYVLPEDVRISVARHEACHLRHGSYLKQDAPLSPGTVHKLEADANRCATVYGARAAESLR